MVVPSTRMRDESFAKIAHAAGDVLRCTAAILASYMRGIRGVSSNVVPNNFVAEAVPELCRLHRPLKTAKAARLFGTSPQRSESLALLQRQSNPARFAYPWGSMEASRQRQIIQSTSPALGIMSLLRHSTNNAILSSTQG